MISRMMTEDTTDWTEPREGGKPGRARIACLCTLALLALGLAGYPAHAQDEGCDLSPKGPCTSVSGTMARACRHEARDDYYTEIAYCKHMTSGRRDCIDEAREGRSEAMDGCVAQCQARQDLCDAVGQGRYDPDFDPADFVDPNDIGGTVAPNPYFPLVVGTEWVWEAGDETITDTVTDETKLIEGVTCRVVRDVVEEDGVLIELTDDWYAQDLEGNVWYCGELARDYEIFEGDSPEEPELVEIGGSFKTGREGALPGILMPAIPQPGVTYRQEISFGDAEDAATITSITGTESVPAATCTNDCVVTSDFTPIEPGVVEFKYYAAGVGLILEIDVDGERVELVEFTQP